MLWPGPVEEVAAAVRRHVTDETARLTGLKVRSADITVHAVTPEAAASETRRVQ